jgi:hypothetical protein
MEVHTKNKVLYLQGLNPNINLAKTKTTWSNNEKLLPASFSINFHHLQRRTIL